MLSYLINSIFKLKYPEQSGTCVVVDCSIIPEAWNIHTVIVMFHPLWNLSSRNRVTPISVIHSRLSLAWDHVRGDIDDPCYAIADFC